jgi:hypothetical protein
VSAEGDAETIAPQLAPAFRIDAMTVTLIGVPTTRALAIEDDA